MSPVPVPGRRIAPAEWAAAVGLLALVGGGLAWAVGQVDAGGAEPGAARAAVGAVLDDQVAAWNKGDLDGFMATYWKSDYLRFFSGGTVTKGWQATLDRYKKRYQADGKEMGTLTFEDLDVQVLAPDAAVARGRWKLKLSKENPEGLFTLVLRKFPDGWKIVHDHTSAADPPKKPD